MFYKKCFRFRLLKKSNDSKFASSSLLLPIFPAHWPRLLQRSCTFATRRRNLSHNSFCQIPSVSSEELTGPSRSHPLWTVPTSLPQSQHSLALLPMQDKTEEKFLQRLRTPSAVSNSPLSGLSRIWASPGRHLWHHFFHFLTSGPDLWAWPDSWVYKEFLQDHAPIPRKESGSTTTTKLISHKCALEPPIKDVRKKSRKIDPLPPWPHCLNPPVHADTP